MHEFGLINLRRWTVQRGWPSKQRGRLRTNTNAGTRERIIEDARMCIIQLFSNFFTPTCNFKTPKYACRSRSPIPSRQYTIFSQHILYEKGFAKESRRGKPNQKLRPDFVPSYYLWLEEISKTIIGMIYASKSLSCAALGGTIILLPPLCSAGDILPRSIESPSGARKQTFLLLLFQVRINLFHI
jgi:hypothetical protein